MDGLLRRVLGHAIRAGDLKIVTASGTALRFGDGRPPSATVRFASKSWQRAVLLDPELQLGEAFMAGGLVVEAGSIADFLAIAMPATGRLRAGLVTARLLSALRYPLRHVAQFNRPARARANAHRHYDLDGRLYAMFLDSDRQYSCAYFERPDQSLDDAQRAKKRHIAAKLLVGRDMRVLDIGCGWGGLSLYLAEMAGARVTGITLADEQWKVARERAAEHGLEDRVRIDLRDYRDVAGEFDRIVSVGMFEHVGVDFYDTYFRKAHDLLAEDGVMLLHAIGRSEGPGIANPWIRRHIFPGGYIPALSEVLPAIERAGFLVTDVEILRLHYAETLKNWRLRFLARREEIERMTDERFCRMWEFYLSASEMAFRHQGLMAFQIQLAKREGIVPITRGYIAEREARLRATETGRPPTLRLAGE